MGEGGGGMVLNREITITNNLIYFLNFIESMLVGPNHWSKPQGPTYQLVTLTGTSLRLCFCINQFHSQFIKEKQRRWKQPSRL